MQEVTPEEGRERQVARLLESGPDTRNLIRDARRVGQSWVAAVKAKRLDVRFGDWQCHRAGCLVGMRHGSLQVLDSATNAITGTDDFHGWNGEKIRTGPEEGADGRIDVTWILLAPREGEPAFQSADARSAPPTQVKEKIP